MSDTTRTQTQTRVETQEAAQRRQRAGAFDIRNLLGALIGLYGVVLVLTGLFATTDSELTRAGGLNINLMAGLSMVVAAAAFMLWARLRPVVPDEPSDLDRP